MLSVVFSLLCPAEDGGNRAALGDTGVQPGSPHPRHLAPGKGTIPSSSSSLQPVPGEQSQHSALDGPTLWSPCPALCLFYCLSCISSFIFCLESSLWSFLHLALGLHPRGLILNLAVHLPIASYFSGHQKSDKA